MILLDNVTIQAGGFTISEVNLAIPSQQYAVLMGKTGCGKTTILETICGLRPTESGRILLMGRDVTHLKVSQRGIGYVPQDRALFSTMTVRDHLAFALSIRKMKRADIARRVAELADMLSIAPLLDRGVRNLSGGEAQRVALGRALSHHPGVLLLDEPLSALDDETRAQMTDLLRQIQQNTGVTVLHVTHSASEADRLARKLFILQNGRIESRPTAKERPMKINVRYSGLARAAAGKSAEEIDLAPSADLRALLAEIVGRYGPTMQSPPLLIFIGDEQVALTSPPALKEGDQVMLLSPISGG